MLLGVRDLAQNDDAATLGAHIAVGVGGKCAAQTGGGQHRGLRERDE